MLAAESVYDALTQDAAVAPVAATGEIPADEPALHVAAYQTAFDKSWVAEELKVVRNCHAAFHGGLLPGVLCVCSAGSFFFPFFLFYQRWRIPGADSYTGAATFLTKGKEPWTLPSTAMDSERTEPAAMHKPIAYPKPDGKLSFDLLSNLARSGTNHEDQPSHLKARSRSPHTHP